MKNRITIKQNNWKSNCKILGNKNFSGFSIYLINSIYNLFRREYNWENISKLKNKLIKKITIITDTEPTGRNTNTMDGEIHSTDKNVVYFKVILCNPSKIVINKLSKTLQLKSFKKLNNN